VIENTPNQLTKRHIARLLKKLECLNIPPVAFDAIKTEMFYLANDIVSLISKENLDGTEQNFNR
jgi:hypothetical protein